MLSVAAYALGRGTRDGAGAYSGTTAEVVGATFLATATVVASFLAVRPAAPGRGGRGCSDRCWRPAGWP